MKTPHIFLYIHTETSLIIGIFVIVEIFLAEKFQHFVFHAVCWNYVYKKERINN